MSPPIISPYKKWFAVKRIFQTLIGGPKLCASVSITLFQAVIYLIPAVILVLVNVIDSPYLLGWQWKAVLTGVGILLTDVTLTFLIWILKQRKDANIGPVLGAAAGGDIDGREASPDNSQNSATLFDEEEAVPDDGCFRSSTWRFIASNVNMSMCHFSAVLASAISAVFCVAILADQSVHPVLRALVILTICNARYSSVINAPPEVGTFDPVKRRHLFYRPFYVSIWASIYFAIMIVKDTNSYNDGGSGGVDGVTKSHDVLELSTELASAGVEQLSGELHNEVPRFEATQDLPSLQLPSSTTSCYSSYFALVLSVLPLIWLSGVLPPLDALFPWLVEMVLGIFGGKSIGYTYFGTTVSLAFAVVGPLATFILSQEMKVTFLLECLCGYLISCDTGSMPKLKASLCEDIPAKYFLQQLIKPSVTILCSLVSILIAETTVSHTGSIPEREIYHPVFASLSIFILFTTKLIQALDIVHHTSLKLVSHRSRLCLSVFSMWHGLLTVVLHVWLTLELTTIHLENTRTKLLDAVVHSLHQLLPCILTIRFFALAVTEPHKSCINIFLTCLIQLLLLPEREDRAQFIFILFAVSLGHDVFSRLGQNLRMVLIFVYATFSSTFIERKFLAGAVLCLSAPISLVSLCVASVVKGMTLVPMFTLPIFTLGFPRPHSFWKGQWFLKGCRHNETQKIMPVASSVDWTLYADVAPFLLLAFSKRCEETQTDLEPGSCYIARYDDRLMFIRIVSSGWKFLYAQVKGLEIQEQTSCHHQEAAWMDEMFDKYLLSSTSCFKGLRSYPMSLVNSLQPKFCLSVPSYSESKSQLPNFLSKAGKLIFRDMFFRAFSYLWIKGNPAFQGESYRRPIASGVPLGNNQPRRVLERSHSTLKNGHYGGASGTTPSGNPASGAERNSFQLTPVGGPDMNGNRAHSFKMESQESLVGGSYGSLRGTSAPMRQHPQLRDVSANNWQGSVSYPLIPGLPNMAVEESELESLPSLPDCTNTESNAELTNEISTSVTISPPSVLSTRRNVGSSSWDGLPQFWMKQCVGDAIPHNAVKARVEKLCWKAWEIAFGTHDDLYEVDMARFYRREFARNMRSAMIHEKPDFEDIAVRAFRYATKLTLDEIYASGTDIDDPFTNNPSTASHASLEIPENTSVVTSRSEEDEQGIFLQLSSFEKAFRFCAYDEIPYWMSDKTRHIVAISADGDKNTLRIFNYQNDGVEFAIGELSRCCVEGIWSSLNTELLYLTSDDDERYSIQHSKYLLRNICAQSAQTLGYPVYEASFRVNLFDFSVEQVST